MRQHTIGTTLAILFLLGLGLTASVPQAQAVSLEEFPTSTRVVVAGWNNPTNAYANDGFYTDSSTNTACQEYSDFGFAIPSDATIDQVHIKANLYSTLSVFQSEGEVAFTIESWDGSAWHSTNTVQVVLLDSWIDQADIIYSANTEIAQNHTTYIDTPAKVNNIKLQITSIIVNLGGGTTSGTVNVDFVSVEVAYTTEEAANMLPVGFLLGALIILPIGILIAKKR